MPNKAILLLGPTAVGKSSIAIDLAQTRLAQTHLAQTSLEQTHPQIEIISVDATLIYRDLNIGSAKPSLAELNLVPHHLIDIRSPLESYSVAEFINDATRLIKDINQRGKVPLLVGGTMMYFNALINGISDLPVANEELREKLKLEFAELGTRAMHAKLVSLDQLAAAKIDPNDQQRIMRALEVCYLTGQTISSLRALHKRPALDDCELLKLAIVPDNRQLLHERINQRFEQMLANHLIDEVLALKAKYPELTENHNSMRSVGYRQVWQYLLGNITRNELIEQGTAATRQLAKRQITWLRSLPVNVIDDAQLNSAKLLKQITEQIRKFI